MAEIIQYEIKHVSRYRYASPARQCVMLLCLKPRDDRGQRLFRFEIETKPQAFLNGETDCFGNTRHVLNVHREHEALEITVHSKVEPMPFTPLPSRLGAGAWQEIDSWKASFTHWDFTHPSELTKSSPALANFVDRNGIKREDDPLKDLLRLSNTLHSSFHYAPGSTSAASPIEDILKSGRGVCQDYVHVMVAIARSWGIPARYVSGYLHDTGLSSEEARENATHAWVECLLPELGWVGFDPTNRSFADERHVRIAVGRDYQDVSPTRGVRQGGGDTQLEVDVRMCAQRGAHLHT
jgi:transglutaminase-like putative cysteine protease